MCYFFCRHRDRCNRREIWRVNGDAMNSGALRAEPIYGKWFRVGDGVRHFWRISEVAGNPTELAVEIHPLAHPQVVEVLVTAHSPEPITGQLPLLVAEVVPQRHDRE